MIDTGRVMLRAEHLARQLSPMDAMDARQQTSKMIASSTSTDDSSIRRWKNRSVISKQKKYLLHEHSGINYNPRYRASTTSFVVIAWFRSRERAS